MVFHTHTDREEDLNQPNCQKPCKSAVATSGDDLDGIERASTQHENREEYETDESTNEKRQQPEKPSLELKRTASRASNALDRVFTTRSLTNPGPPPDGGIKAWTQVACGWFVIFTTWGWVNSYGSFQTYYTLNLDESASTISWIGTIQNWFTFFVGAFSGRLLDAGLFVPTLIVGSLLQLIGIFLMSVSTKFWHLMLTQGVLTGLGGGIFFTPSMGLIATYFNKKRAFAIGIATTGNSAGGMIYPVIVRQLLPQIGFPWTVRVLGFLNLALLALVIAFMRPRLPPRKSGPLVDWSAFTEKTYAFFVGGLFFVIWGIYYTFYYIASFGVDEVGLEFTASTVLVIVINGVGFPARVIPPYFADKVGQLNMLVPTLFCLMIVAYCWLAVDSVPGLYVFTCFYGLVSAAFQCLIPSTVASITPDLSMVGTRLGMAFSTLSFAALTGPPIGGALQSTMGGDYTGASVWAATSVLVCFVLFVLARLSKAGTKLGVKC
ncbi:MFS transporter, MCP family, solute carrier family 16, member 10 [Hortaea werneckii]|nr:MFS transporter, MCP family, solute carrier family 16, member 10 [Hortaea werneckii]KAI7106260.1 MFS transporter, MCP family, solute carrier family 16, member 10 [Hortaea werneckii]KAI7225032.1 MFS transporter, MCP family, solute carrier family 16, member 10 [Hortaea werneckii]KAI7329729.1 MFS transporter, MCP family, solute carrier family 16, member 10 [Hortaea werneckii]KAI7395196.1 MFS transporter, MCP family, solute carrier family 16, member 10 [Hortaea werneckii]